MIVSLRGGNGSGKSHLVLTTLDLYDGVAHEASSRGKPRYHSLILAGGKTLGFVGGYNNPCGGCDGIHPYEEIWPRVLDLRGKFDHVLFEGMAVSSSYGSIGRASEAYGDEVVFVFLDTPLEKCVRNVAARRAARGVTGPFDAYNVIRKWVCVQRSYYQIRDVHKRAVVVLDHRAPVGGLVTLLRRGYDPANTGPPFPPEVPHCPSRPRGWRAAGLFG